jgi:hypothetical protein
MNRFDPTAEELAEIEDYESALQDAHDAGEPWFSLEEFRARAKPISVVSEPAPLEEEIPF